MLTPSLTTEGALETIATLPSKEELLAEAAGYILAPFYNFMGLINAVLWEFTAIVEAVIEKQGEITEEQGGSQMAASTKVQELFEALKGLTLLELKQLVDLFKEEFGVTAAAPVAVAAPVPAAAPAAEAAAAALSIITHSARKINYFQVIAEQ